MTTQTVIRLATHTERAADVFCVLFVGALAYGACVGGPHLVAIMVALVATLLLEVAATIVRDEAQVRAGRAQS